MKKLVLCLFLTGCSVMPTKQAYVVWQTPCSNGVQLKNVWFTDTNAPVLSCIKTMPAADKAKYVLMTLLGFPVAACAVTYDNGANEIFMSYSPGVSQVINTVGTLQSPESLLQHELSHFFGMEHPMILPFLDSCKKEP